MGMFDDLIPQKSAPAVSASPSPKPYRTEPPPAPTGFGTPKPAQSTNMFADLIPDGTVPTPQIADGSTGNGQSENPFIDSLIRTLTQSNPNALASTLDAVAANEPSPWFPKMRYVGDPSIPENMRKQEDFVATQESINPEWSPEKGGIRKLIDSGMTNAAGGLRNLAANEENLPELKNYGIQDIIQDDGVLPALSRTNTFVREGLGSAVGSMVPTVAGGIAGFALPTLIGQPQLAPAGAVAGAFAPSYALNAGGVWDAIKEENEKAAKEGRETLTPAEMSDLALGAAIPIAALDVTGLESIANGLAGSAKKEIFRAAARKVLESKSRSEGLKEGAKLIGKETAKEAGKGFIAEGATEGGQQAIQDLTTTKPFGKDYATKETALDIANNAIIGGLAGGARGAGPVSLAPSINAASKRIGKEKVESAPEIVESAADVETPSAAGKYGIFSDLVPVQPETKTAIETPIETPSEIVKNTNNTDNTDNVVKFPEKKAEPQIQKLVTPRGDQEIEAMFDVVDAKNLVTSDSPDFPQVLQPRDRSRKTSDLQIQDISNKLDPERLSESRTTDTGAPIVSMDNIVESGNGRVMGIRKAYEQGNEASQKYRDFLTSRGYDVSGMEAPVLVRKRKTELSPEDLVRFTIASNERTGASLSSTERAMADAKAISDDMAGKYVGGDVTSPDNRGFINSFISQVAPADRGSMISADGELSQDGVRRIRGALLAKAYDDSDVVQSTLENNDTEIKSIGNALTSVAGQVAAFKAGVEKGETPKALDITKNVIEAAKIIRDAKANNKAVADSLTQGAMFDEQKISPVTEAIIRSWYNPTMKRQISQQKIESFLRKYYEEAAKANDGGNMFGLPDITPQDIIDIARPTETAEAETGGLDLQKPEVISKKETTTEQTEIPENIKKLIDNAGGDNITHSKNAMGEDVYSFTHAANAASEKSAGKQNISAFIVGGQNHNKGQIRRVRRTLGSDNKAGWAPNEPSFNPIIYDNVESAKEALPKGNPVNAKNAPTETVVSQKEPNTVHKKVSVSQNDSKAENIDKTAKVKAQNPQVSQKNVKVEIKGTKNDTTEDDISQQVEDLVNGGIYRLSDKELKSFIDTTKVKKFDNYDGLPISKKREVVRRWLENRQDEVVEPAPKKRRAGARGGDANTLPEDMGATELKDSLEDRLAEEAIATGKAGRKTGREFAKLVVKSYENWLGRVGDSPVLRQLVENHLGSGLSIQGENVRAINGTEYNQRGELKTETKEFKKWFGNSKIVDADGKPLVVYHGTGADIEKFEKRNTGAGSRESPIGYWFTENPTAASSFADFAARGSGANVVPVYISMQNPLYVKSYDEIKDIIDDVTDFARPNYTLAGRNIRMQQDKINYDRAVKKLKKKGYDGIILENTLVDSPDAKTRINQYVVFDKPQAKSINNRGTWNKNKDNILYQTEDKTRPISYEKTSLGWQAVLPGAEKVSDVELDRKKLLEKMREAAEKGFDLFQRQDGEARGSITFMPDGKTLINMFDKANASTPFHELGHDFLELLKNVASNAEAPENVTRDWKTTQDWLGLSDNQPISTEQHEQFARGFESYLRDGRAPTPELKSLFDTFKQWLTDIYRSVTKLNVELTDDMRGVFDRMIAGEKIDDIASGDGELSVLADRSSKIPSADISKLTKTERASLSKLIWEESGYDPDKVQRYSLDRQFEIAEKALSDKFGVKAQIAKDGNKRHAVDNMADLYVGLKTMAALNGLPEKLMGLQKVKMTKDGKESGIGLRFVFKKDKRNGTLGAYFNKTHQIHIPGRSNSVAHEWGHALDYSVLEAMGDTEDAAGRAFRGYSGKIRRVGEQNFKADSVVEAWVDLMNTIFFDDAMGATTIMALQKKIETTKSDKVKADAQAQIDKIKAGNWQGKSYRSEYFRDAKSIPTGSDKGYWTRPTEMVARAFESYMSDKFKDVNLPTDIMTFGNEMYQAGSAFEKLYPQGVDRDRIFAKIAAVMSAIQESDILDSGNLTPAELPKEVRVDPLAMVKKQDMRKYPSGVVGQIRKELGQIKAMLNDIRNPDAKELKAAELAKGKQNINKGIDGWVKQAKATAQERKVLQGLIRNPEKYVKPPKMADARFAELKDAAGEIRKTYDRPLADRALSNLKTMIMAINSSEKAMIHAIEARNPKSKALSEIISGVAASPGKKRDSANTYTNHKRQFINKYGNRLAAIVDNFGLEKGLTSWKKNKLETQLLRDLYFNPDEANIPSGITKERAAELATAAAELNRLIKDVSYEFDRAGIDVGETHDVPYLRRIYDKAKIWSDKKGFIEQARKTYLVKYEKDIGKADNLDLEQFIELAKEAGFKDNTEIQLLKQQLAEEKKAQIVPAPVMTEVSPELYDTVVDSASRKDAADWLNNMYVSPEFSMGGSPSGFMKARALPAEADQLLQDYMVSDPVESTLSLIDGAADKVSWRKYVEPEDGYLINAERQAIADGWHFEDTQLVVDMIRAEGGRAANATGPIRKIYQATVGLLHTAATVALMGRSVFASIVEPITYLHRTGHWGGSIKVWGNLVKEIVGTADAREKRRIVQAWGLIENRMTAITHAERSGGLFEDSPRTQRFMNRFFESNLLAPLTRAQRSAAMQTLPVWFNVLSHDILDADSKPHRKRAAIREFVEAGVPENKVEEFSHYVQSLNMGFPSIDESYLPKTMPQMYMNAIGYVTDHIIQNPSRMDRPLMANSPTGRFVYGLMTFQFAYYDNIIKRKLTTLREDFKEDGFAVGAAHTAEFAAALALQISLASTVFLIRSALFNPDLLDKKMEDDELFDYVMAGGFSYASPLSPLASTGLNIWTSAKYQKDLANYFVGAQASYYLQPAESWKDYFMNNSPNTDTAERHASEALYRMFIGLPSSILSGYIPGGGAIGTTYGVANMFISSRGAETAVINAIYGPKEKKKKTNEKRYLGKNIGRFE